MDAVNGELTDDFTALRRSRSAGCGRNETRRR
jgi:hypothetical protein